MTFIGLMVIYNKVFFYPRGLRLQQIRRLLFIAERYVASIENAFPGVRKILPHAASFHGYPMKIKVVNDSKKNEYVLEVIELF